MRSLFVLCLVFFFNLPLFAQSVDTAWVRRYNGLGDHYDAAWDITVDNACNVYVTGRSTSDNCVTIKYNPGGDTAWVRRYVGPADHWDEGRAIGVDHSGNVYVSANSWADESNHDIATVRYNPNGDEAWVKRYNGPGNYTDWPSDLTLDTLGNVYVSGRSPGSGTDIDYVTIKYHPDGDTAWIRRYNGPGNSYDIPYALSVDNSGNVYVTGGSQGSGTDRDFATLKYYPNGDTAWLRRYNAEDSGSDYAEAIALDDVGNVYITGASYNSVTLDDYLTIKYYSSGDTAWVRRYNGELNVSDIARSIAVDHDYNVYVTGTTDFGMGPQLYGDYCTIKYYQNGDTAWVRTYDGPGNYSDEARKIALDDSGNVYVAGSSAQNSEWPPNYDYTIIKYLPDGTTAWVKRYDCPENKDDMLQAMVLDDSANIYITGYSGDWAITDYTTVKYVQFLRGDTNKDGDMSISDIVYLISYLYKLGPAPVPIQSGDVNCDGDISISDIVYLIAYLFKLGPPPCI